MNRINGYKEKKKCYKKKRIEKREKERKHFVRMICFHCHSMAFYVILISFLVRFTSFTFPFFYYYYLVFLFGMINYQ